MTITSKELNDLLKYFTKQNSTNHIVSLALTANDTVIVGFKQQAVTLDYQPWDLLDVENSSTASLFHQYIDNFPNVSSTTSVTLQYASNDTFANYTKHNTKPRISTEIPIWLIPCYSIILIFAIVGNLLVASTLFQNRRMRTITNVFLANLAISDMLLGVLCMPITLVGTYLRHFIFGELVCKFIQFAQAASVAVSSWTLVAISCERYYAICHPLRSRTWQTINHAYKIIGCIWFGSIICMAPIAIFSQLIPTSRQGLRKCREQWPEEAVGRFYNIFLDLALLVLPLVILCVAYILITRTLYMGIKDEKALIFGNKNNSSNGTANDAKLYTQVHTEMKTPTVFNLNMSFRYQTRKNSNSSSTAEGSMPSVAANNNGRDNVNYKNKYYVGGGNSVGNSKYLAMGSVAVPVVYGSRKSLCFNTLQNTQAETEMSFKDTKDQTHKLRTTQQQQQQQQQQSTDDRNQTVVCTAETAIVMTTSTANRRKLTSKSIGTDGRRPHLYCMRSASVKSLNRCNGSKSVNGGGENDETTASSSCYSLNAMPRSNLEKNLESKKRVVKMLFVLVLEFFHMLDPVVCHQYGGNVHWPVHLRLLAYSSSCCNPITYCFMNASFRRAFVDTFKGMHLNGGSFWHKRTKTATNLSMTGNSIALANSCTVMTSNTVLDSPRL
ncbi:hypothetical protein DOY81_000650 [Sarcophaga bullata]|nr:hypothetical protein DOY81_000650 [Sarcophaga bullata]